MKISNAPRKLALVAGLLSAGMLSQGFAAPTTAAGTTVSNTASITGYTVGGVQQLTGGATIQSNGGVATTFLVDRKIDVVVAQSNSPLTVLAGASGQVLTFTVTNTSNAALDFSLAVANATNGATVPGGTDSDDINGSFTIYADTNGNGSYDAGTDLAATSLSNIPAEVTGNNNHIRTVFVVGNIKTTSVNGAYIGASLTATATNLGGGGAAIAETTGANTAGVDTVYADAAGVAGDTARNAAHSAYGSYFVQTATLAVAKSSAVSWDPFNNATNPKAIPGAVVEYCLVVTNSGAQAASSVVLTDAIPTNTAYYSTVPVGSTGAPTPGVTTGTGAVCGTNPDTTSLGSYASGNVTVNYGSIAAPVLPATSTSVWARFYVTVQ